MATQGVLKDISKEAGDLVSKNFAASTPSSTSPNLTLTPHIAGSQGNEMFRLGDAAVRDVERVLARLPLKHQFQQGALHITA